MTRSTVTTLAANGLGSQVGGPSIPLSFQVKREEERVCMAGRQMAAIQTVFGPTRRYDPMSILDMPITLKRKPQSSLEALVHQHQKASTTIAGREIAETNMVVMEPQSLKDYVLAIAADLQWKAKQGSVQDVDMSRNESEQREWRCSPLIFEDDPCSRLG